jgi:hypothetical protein
MTAPITLPLSDSDYWTAPRKDEERLSFQALDGPEGFTVGAPREVPLERRATLPVVGYYKCSLKDQAAGRLVRTSVLLGARLETGEAWAAPAFEPKEGPKAEATDKEGDAVEWFGTDARRQLGLPWRDGTVRLWLASFDQLSAPREVRLVTDAGRDPAVLAWSEGRRRPAYPPPVSPPPARDPAALPRYGPDPRGPAAPEAPGVAFAHERVAVLAEGRPSEVRAAFCVVLHERGVVRPRPAVTPAPGQTEAAAVAATGWQEVGDPAATAVVPILLVLASATSSDPVVVRIDAPVREPVTAGGPARGAFAIDLLEVAPGLSPGRYSLYAVAGGALSGPSPITFITPEAAADLTR